MPRHRNHSKIQKKHEAGSLINHGPEGLDPLAGPAADQQHIHCVGKAESQSHVDEDLRAWGMAKLANRRHWGAGQEQAAGKNTATGESKTGSSALSTTTTTTTAIHRVIGTDLEVADAEQLADLEHDCRQPGA